MSASAPKNGSVLTDFDESVLLTKTESASGHAGAHSHSSATGQNIFTPEAREAIREAARVGAEAVKEAAVAIREAAEAAREGAEAARRSTHIPQPPTPPRAPKLPKAMSIPTITGGKLVTGHPERRRAGNQHRHHEWRCDVEAVVGK